MAYDLGIYSELYGIEEATYGTAPADNWNKLAFISHGLSKQQNLIPDDVLGLGRDPSDPTRGAINVLGPIVVPLCNQQSGFWLQKIFGDAVSTGATNFTHTFSSGAATLPSASIQLWMPKLAKGRTALGAQVNEFSIEMGRETLPVMRMTLIAQDEAADVAVRDGTPLTALTLTRFHAFQGFIKKDAVTMGDIISATLTYRNNLDIVAPIRSDGLIAETLPGQAAFEATIRVRVKDGTLLDIAGTTTPIELAMGYTIGANNDITFTAYRVFLPNPTKEVNGPGGIEVTFNVIGAKDTSPAKMFDVILKNQVATYVS